MSLRLGAFLLLLLPTVAALGCAPVKPWEREILGHPDMAWEPDGLESAYRKHVQFSKEAAMPGGGAGGGGCGCN